MSNKHFEAWAINGLRGVASNIAIDDPKFLFMPTDIPDRTYHIDDTEAAYLGWCAATTEADPTASSIAQRAAQMILDRDAAGQRKYGASMDRGDLSLDQWLQHAIEELLDGAQYLIKAKTELAAKRGEP